MWGGRRMEKKIVGKGFGEMLGESVRWGEKEELREGVGYSWIDRVKGVRGEGVSEEEMGEGGEGFGMNRGEKKEE